LYPRQLKKGKLRKKKRDKMGRGFTGRGKLRQGRKERKRRGVRIEPVKTRREMAGEHSRGQGEFGGGREAKRGKSTTQDYFGAMGGRATGI